MSDEEGAAGCCLVVIGIGLLVASWALLLYIGPPLLYFVTLVISATAPVLYGRALFRVFGRDGVAGLLLAPAVALLALVYMDFVCLLSFIYMDVVHDGGVGEDALLAGVVEGCHRAVAATAVYTLGNDLFHGFIGLFDPSAARTPIAIAISAAAKLSCIPPVVLVARGASTLDTGPEQPAYVEYFRRQAFLDLGTVLRISVVDVYLWLAYGARAVFKAVFGCQAIVLWPLALVAYLSMAVMVLVAATMFAVIAVVHTLSLALIWLGAMWFSKALYLAERSVMFARSRYAKCPHQRCHEPVPLPVFTCPACGVRHDRLVPGRFGFLWRKCECGKASLPTLFLLGKGRREAFCPHCSGAMPSALFGSNVHVPVYGGPSSGKTMLVMAEAYQMLERRWTDVSARLITARARRMYSSTWKRQYESRPPDMGVHFPSNGGGFGRSPGRLKITKH